MPSPTASRLALVLVLSSLGLGLAAATLLTFKSAQTRVAAARFKPVCGESIRSQTYKRLRPSPPSRRQTNGFWKSMTKSARTFNKVAELWKDEVQPLLQGLLDLGDNRLSLISSAGPARLRWSRGSCCPTCHEWGIAWNGIPIAKASRTWVSAKGEVIIRDRNIPRNVTLIEGKVVPTDSKAAERASLDHARLFLLSLGNTRSGPVGVDLKPNKPQLVIWLDRENRGQFAWEVQVHGRQGPIPLSRRYWVAAHDNPRILDFEDHMIPKTSLLRPRARLADSLHKALAGSASARRFVPRLPRPLQVKGPLPPRGTWGQVTGPIWAASPFDRNVYPLRNVAVTLTSHSQTTYTDEDGIYSFPDATGEVHVRATLFHESLSLINLRAPKAPACQVTRSGTGRIDLHFDGKQEEDLALFSAFFWISEARHFVQDFLPPQGGLTALRRVLLRVNATEDTDSDAGWAKDEHGNCSITFLGRSGNRPNMALCDVALHEYGHGLDEQWGGIHDWGYSEGFADAVMILYTRDSVFGQFLGEEYRRNAADSAFWSLVKPTPNTPPPLESTRDQGRVYAGFVWDLIGQLKRLPAAPPNAEDGAYQVAKELILCAGQLDPGSIPDAVACSFLVDAFKYPPRSPGQASKHFAALRAAAKSRDLWADVKPLLAQLSLLPTPNSTS